MELEKSCRDNRIIEKSFQDKLLEVIYGNALGRILIRPFVSPWFSKLGGYLLDCRVSAPLIKPFVKINGIDLSECETTEFSTYNSFFTRKMKKEARPISAEGLIAPCDARLSVYPIEKDGYFQVKHTPYTVESLLKNKEIAERYEGGTVWLFRLCVDDYHRYIYPADALKSKNIRIPGIFHTVNPIANDVYPIYKENTREYCLLKTQDCGTILMMEVGALLVGEIENHELKPSQVVRGDEKGHFAFGGSTIILLTQKERVAPDTIFVENTRNGIETKVKMGQKIGAIRDRKKAVFSRPQ